MYDNKIMRGQYCSLRNYETWRGSTRRMGHLICTKEGK